jgi:thiosulfate/3-mercaptopyruvate sulfurtransferase
MFAIASRVVRWSFVSSAVLPALLVVVVGCSGGQESARRAAAPPPIDLAPPAVIVDGQWLSGHLDNDGLIVADARTAQEYAEGHIEGAIHLDPQRLLDSDPSNSKNMAPVDVIQRVLGEVGIDMQHTVVIYDGKDFREAARVFWVFEVHGHPRAAVLNGGVQGWVAAGRPLSREPVAPRAAVFIANMNSERYYTKLDVYKSLDASGTVILDSRTDEEYAGRVSAARRKGHIKNAVNIEYKRNLVFSPEGACSANFSEEMRSLYRDELRGTTRIVAYCNSGNRASVSYLILRSLGYPVSVYDGSWLEWGNDPNMPIEIAPSAVAVDPNG